MERISAYADYQDKIPRLIPFQFGAHPLKVKANTLLPTLRHNCAAA
jgi:hypothetical protein